MEELTRNKVIDQHSNRMIEEAMIQESAHQILDKELEEMFQLQDMVQVQVQDQELRQFYLAQEVEIQEDILPNQDLAYLDLAYQEPNLE